MTPLEILEQLDACASQFTFPVLDNGYIYPVDVRMSIYRDDSDWLMVIETLGVNNMRTSGFDSFNNCLYLYGSVLHREPGTANSDFLCPMSDCADDPLFKSEYEWFAKEDASCVMVRDQRVELDLSESRLAQKGIRLSILRSLVPEHRSELLASETELAGRNPNHLPLWLMLDEWHHPDIAAGEKPSDSETFQMLAKAITAGDKSAYRPSKGPNTHWKNWPEGGTL